MEGPGKCADDRGGDGEIKLHDGFYLLVQKGGNVDQFDSRGWQLA